jgi:hypothetical protein
VQCTPGLFKAFTYAKKKILLPRQPGVLEGFITCNRLNNSECESHSLEGNTVVTIDDFFASVRAHRSLVYGGAGEGSISPIAD